MPQNKSDAQDLREVTADLIAVLAKLDALEMYVAAAHVQSGLDAVHATAALPYNPPPI